MILLILYIIVIFVSKKTTITIRMKKFSIKVPGVDFTLESNQIYHIREVSDSNAPDGFQKVGISKHPLPGISEGIIVPHDGISWDTAFNQKSSCYRAETPLVAGKIYKTLNDNLIPEIEELVEGDIRSIKSDSNALFDEFIPFNGTGYGEDKTKYKIKGGNMFNTTNPLEFLALLWMLMGKKVMPPNKENSGAYLGCTFVIEDKKQTTSLEQDKEFDKTMAMSTVLAIVKNNNKKELKHLQNIFTYLDLIIDVENTEMKPLITIFSNWSKKGGYNNENSVEFNEVYEKFEKETDREELVAYVKLCKDIKESKIKLERRDIIVDGKNLGSDKKAAARKIVADQELYKTFLEI